MFRFRRPSAVPRRIWAVIVRVAVNGVPRRRARPHVCIKRLEALAPFVANVDPTAAIVRVAGIVRVFAALDNACPTVVFGSSVGLPVLPETAAGRFFGETAAG